MFSLSILPSKIDGLSLCVQGTFDGRQTIINVTRFIPVCTGNIMLPVLMPVMNAVYPCVYREHITDATKWRDLDGLSLCVQGTW